MRPRPIPFGPAVFLIAVLAANPTGAQVCGTVPLWQNLNPVTRATSDARFGLGLSLVATGPVLRAVWNETASLPTPHVAGETRWSWTTGGSTISNFPNPVILSSDNKEYVFLGTADGRLHRIDATTGAGAGSFDARRPGCASDQIVATPAVQLYDDSDAAFQNDMNLNRGHPDDLVFVITSYGCGDHSSNRVYALYASDLTVKWVFNAAATVPMDLSTEGCSVDYGLNRLYCGTERTFPTQPSVWALQTINGALAWSNNAGSIRNRPTLHTGGLYVLSSDDHWRKFNALTGAALWDYAIGATVARSGSWQNKILALDSGGALRLIEDGPTGPMPVWGPVSPGGGLYFVTAPAVAPEIGKAYVGRNDGFIQQVSTSTGTVEIAVSAQMKSPLHDPTVDFSGPSTLDPDRLLVPSLDGTIARFCIPWGGLTAVWGPAIRSPAFPLTARPNPTTGVTRLEFDLPLPGRVELDVTDVTGARVRGLLDSNLPSGPNAVRWDGLDDGGRVAAAGIYFVRLRARGPGGEIRERSTKVELVR